MSITLQGIEAEKRARELFKKNGIHNLQQFDWFVKHPDGNYYVIEVKQRSLFEPPPFWGTGLDIRQVRLRTQIYDDLGIDTWLIVFETDTQNIYTQKLSILEKTKYFDTMNKIRIYNINEYIKITEEP